MGIRMKHLLCNHLRLLQLVAFMVVANLAWAASPCTGVNRNFTNERKKALAPVIAKQLKVKNVVALRSFQVDGWSILYVEPQTELEPAYLFYSRSPLTSRYITLWAGVVTEDDDEKTIQAWAFKNAPGIPHRLATCFAWHVMREGN
jgi:hypothetical protein